MVRAKSTLGNIQRLYNNKSCHYDAQKVEKMNLVQSHRLEVHRKGFRTHRQCFSVDATETQKEKNIAQKNTKIQSINKLKKLINHK